MTQVNDATGTVPVVSSGVATVRVLHDGGEMVYPAQEPLFPGGMEIDLRGEGELTFVDVNAKGNAARREKLKDPKGDGTPSRLHFSILFFSPTEKKYGGVCACALCGTGVRKWTSDMHQSFYDDACKAKAKKAAGKAARAAIALPGSAK